MIRGASPKCLARLQGALLTALAIASLVSGCSTSGGEQVSPAASERGRPTPSVTPQLQCTDAAAAPFTCATYRLVAVQDRAPMRPLPADIAADAWIETAGEPRLVVRLSNGNLEVPVRITSTGAVTSRASPFVTSCPAGTQDCEVDLQLRQYFASPVRIATDGQCMVLTSGATRIRGTIDLGG